MITVLANIQFKSHRMPVPFELHLNRIYEDEVAQSKFYAPSGQPVTVKSKKELHQFIVKHGHMLMLNKLFQKETVYKVLPIYERE